MTGFAGKRADMLVHQADPYNAEPPRRVLGLAPLTPVDTFYVRSHGPVPALVPAEWRLRVHGLVERPLEVSPAELRVRFPERRLVATLQCAGNRRAGLMAVRDIPGEAPWGPGATGNAEWTGVALADVLREAGLRDDARYVEFIGSDLSAEVSPPQAFGGSIARHKALAGEVLVAWAMNGEPLPPAHGAPLRVVVPGYIGARSVKWLEQIVARETPSDNFFQSTAYRLVAPDREAGPGEGFALGAVAVNCDFLTPEDGARVPAGPLVAEGYAVAGDDRYVERVDVSTDGGATWRQAELLDPASPWGWRRWRIRLAVAEGEVELLARAWDSAADTQPRDAADLWNPKGYVNNAWARVRVQVDG